MESSAQTVQLLLKGDKNHGKGLLQDTGCK